MLSREELERYSRHILLPGIGRPGQEKLKASRVFVVGAGGLGSPVLLYLAAAGVGHISFADSDIVELANLQRQVLYKVSDLGRPKAQAAHEALSGLNTHVELQPLILRLNAENARGYLRAYDLVIETSDNFPTKFLVNDACYLNRTNLILAGIFRFEGQIFSIQPGESACYRCIFDDPPPVEFVPDCSQAGVFGATAGVVGAMQAAIALRVLTGAGSPPFGEMMTFDLSTGKVRNIALPRNPACRLCAKKM